MSWPKSIQDGAPKIAKLPYKWLNCLTMVYGRDNELVNGGFVMVYKPTDLVGGFNNLENISPLGLLFPIYGKIKHIPNHQSVIIGGANSYDGQFEAIWQLAATLMYLPFPFYTLSATME